MKLLTLILALFVTTSMAVAQNSSSTVSQTGSSSDAVVSQTGSQHSSTILQESSFGTGHLSEVTQSGAENAADLWQNQANAEAYVTQSGNLNEARSKQSGYNVMNVTQTGDENVVGGYFNVNDRAFQNNGTGLFANGMNDLMVAQTGSYNEAGAWQEHEAIAKIKQNGDDNDAFVYQTQDPNRSRHSGEIYQNGDGNAADINQQGDGHYAYVHQGLYGSGSNDNTADIDQSGHVHSAFFMLNGGDGNSATISQKGNNHSSTYKITLGDDNSIDADVKGHSNRTLFNIEDNAGVYSSGNDITVGKTGMNNNLAGYIQGGGNDVSVEQNGNMNNIGTSLANGDGINIHGDMNNVTVGQYSDGNQSLNTVTGSSNMVNVTQN